MTYYIKNGNTFRVTSEDAVDIHNNLPAANYIIKEDPYGNLFLEVVDSFSEINKYYGDTVKNTDRIINTYLSRPNSTGCLFAGEKGSGKSLLSKKICVELAKKNIPTIIINSPWCGDKFNQLIQDIDQECVVLFDEFEKIYDKKDQESILTLLDGVFPTKKLFLFTVNDKWAVDSHMKNRPGRIFYFLEYNSIGVEFIKEYCEDNLKNKNHIEQVCKISTLFEAFNFDMLKAMVEEMNRYNESPQEVMTILNANPRHESFGYGKGDLYDVSVIYKGNLIEKEYIDTKTIQGNPISKTYIEIWFNEYEVASDDDDDDDEKQIYVKLYPTDLVKIDPEEGMFTYKQDETVILIKKQKKEQLNYFSAI